MTNIAVVCINHDRLDEAKSLAQHLGVEVLDESVLHYDVRSVPEILRQYYVQFSDRVELKSSSEKHSKPGVFVDFVSGKSAHRRLYGGGKNQLISKAVGLNKKKGLAVLDATAGLGRDAFVLASLGATVSLLERSPVALALLQDGILRAQQSEDLDTVEIIHAMKLLSVDSRKYLNTLEQSLFDVIYLDPMFPPRTKSAAIKKEMAAFHSVIGKDEDSAELLGPAIHVAKYRVVVKRPKGAPYLSGSAPTFQIEGKTSRYDIYVNQGLT